MSDTSRRSVLQALGGALLGVAAVSPRPNFPGLFGGFIRATPVEAYVEEAGESPDDHLPPDDVVVRLEDDRVRSSEPIHRATATPWEWLELSRREYTSLESTLEDLPFYDPPHGAAFPSQFLSGVHVRDDRNTYLIELLPRCSETALVKARDGTFSNGPQCTRDNAIDVAV